MADNVVLNTGSGGDTIAADDISGIKHQRVKISVGADGVATDAVGGAGTVSGAVLRITLASDDPAVTALQLIDNIISSDTARTVGVSTVVSANFTRPADTTTYATGDLIANSTTAGSVVALSWSTAARISGGSGMVRRARLNKSTTSLTNASFRLHLYGSDPAASSGITNGDNGAWLTKIANYLGSIDIIVDRGFSDASMGIGIPNVGGEITFIPNSGQTIYGLLESRAAYAPGNAEVYTVELEIYQN